MNETLSGQAGAVQFLPIFALDLKSVERVRLRFDSKHPWTAAHHQKIAAIDDTLAFCGGIYLDALRRGCVV